mmetsp:Transcript_62607/g.179596  ORF Transcript_62607/g.179596 Transcript_62607/m.179596 type:complete len:400 (-) Transcript_62607:197-1396(-)
MSCRSLVDDSTLLGPSLLEPFSTVLAMLFCRSFSTICAWRSSWDLSSSFSCRNTSDASSSSSSPPSPWRPSCRRNTVTSESSSSLFRSKVWMCTLSSRSCVSKSPFRDFNASRFRFVSACSPRNFSASSCKRSKSSRRFSATCANSARCLSTTASTRCTFPGRCVVWGSSSRSKSSPPLAVPLLTWSLSSRSCRWSCAICAARPFQETAAGSSATDRAFSVASSVPNSLSRTLRCLCTCALSSWASCLTCCSVLEAAKNFFLKSSKPSPNIALALPAMAASSAWRLASSLGFLTSVSNCVSRLFWLSTVTCKRRFFFVKSISRCLSSTPGSLAPMPSFFTMSKSFRTCASSASRRASLSCSAAHFVRHSSPPFGEAPRPAAKRVRRMCSSSSSECASGS